MQSAKKRIEVRNRIKVLRSERNLTQSQLGSLVEATRQSIALIEAGEHFPSVILAYKIARVFEKDISEVFIFEEVISNDKA